MGIFEFLHVGKDSESRIKKSGGTVGDVGEIVVVENFFARQAYQADFLVGRASGVAGNRKNREL